jgi:hypothetical protein
LRAIFEGFVELIPEWPVMIVLLIDHRRARFFESADSQSGLQEREHIEPADPHGFRRHLEHRKEANYQGQRVPEADEFYERIAHRLAGASSIVLVGDATGNSSALRYLLGYLEKKHKDVADRVIATEDADLSSITPGDIDEIARQHS